MAWSRGKAYSQDLRERVLALADDGYAVSQVAEQLLVSVSYVSKVLSRRRLTGEVSTRPQRCHVPPKLAGLHNAIAAEVAAKPDATIDELRRWLLATHAMTASKGLMCKTLARLRLTHKKSPSMRPNKRAQTSPTHATFGGEMAGVRTAIEAAGANLLYLPAYSPDLNPIEKMAFAKLKSLLRAKALRTMDELWSALGPISDTFSQNECRNYLRHAGYFQSA